MAEVPLRIPLLLLALFLAVPAAAQTEPDDESPQGPTSERSTDLDEALDALAHDATFTISPLLLVLPIGCEEVAPGPDTPGQNCPNWTIELTGEFPFAPHHTGSLTAGFGWRVTEDGLRRSTIIGGQYRFYPFRDFRGAHVGLEIQRQDFTLASTIVSTQMGPVLGYKLVLPFGLTTEIQGGAGARIFQGQVGFTFLFNLQLGWSFDLSPDK